MKGECPLSECKIGRNNSSKISCPDSLYGLFHRGWLVWDEEDVGGEITEDTIEEEIIS